MRIALLTLVCVLFGLAISGPAVAAGPSGSSECHIQDDDCDGVIDEDTGTAPDDNDGDGRVDEDTGTALDDNDGDGRVDEDTGTALDDNDRDGRIDEDSPGDTNGDGNADDDLDGRVDEDPADDDGDGRVDEDPADDDGDGRVDEDVADDDGDGRIDEDPVGDAADDAGENQVNCNEQTSEDVAGGQLYVGSNGAELCNEGGLAAGPQGRVVATTDQGGYVAIDGDGSNPAPANGYARLDQSGFHCGDENNLDSGASQGTNTQEDCG